MVKISLSESGEGPGRATGRGYSTATLLRSTSGEQDGDQHDPYRTVRTSPAAAVATSVHRVIAIPVRGTLRHALTPEQSGFA